MTDTNPSGASFAPAADPSAPAASAETPAGTFGSTRGSGLARGKRQSGASAPTSSPVKTDYKPTALEVIIPVREYQNPFASTEPASAPVEKPAEDTAPVAPVAMFEPEAPSAPEAHTADVEPEPAAAPEAPAPAEAAEERSEINILPPAESNRPAVSWESHSIPEIQHDNPSRDERPTFRPDRREDRNGEEKPGTQRPQFEGRDPRRDSFQRQPRDPRDARQPRDPRDSRQPRDPRDARQPRDPREMRQPRDPRDERTQHGEGQPARRAPEAAKPSGGFFGWLKGLFAGPKPVETPAPREQGGEPYGDGQRHRRRHRGGRGHGGHGGQNQAFRSERPEIGGERPSHEGDRQGQGGERNGGHRRRRHRGGPGRDRGGEPRSEGNRGGGAI